MVRLKASKLCPVLSGVLSNPYQFFNEWGKMEADPGTLAIPGPLLIELVCLAHGQRVLISQKTSSPLPLRKPAQLTWAKVGG